MSLILEALNRARREQHNAAPVPGVDSEHYYPSAAAENPWRQRGLLLALAAALLVIGGLLGREFSRDGTEPPAAVTERQAAVAEAPFEVPPAAAIPGPGAESESVPSSEAAQAAPELPAPVVASSPSQPPPSALTGSRARAEVAALYQKPTAPEAAPDSVRTTAPAPVQEEAVDIASLVAAAEQALEDVRLTEHSAPFLGDLSQQRKDAVPTLMYLQHDFRTEGGSTVTINGQLARAGQTVGRGVKVEEILPDSVVLSHDGQQFRLRALNSWVNL